MVALLFLASFHHVFSRTPFARPDIVFIATYVLSCIGAFAIVRADTRGSQRSA
jgi:hypothetical protein